MKEKLTLFQKLIEEYDMLIESSTQDSLETINEDLKFRSFLTNLYQYFLERLLNPNTYPNSQKEKLHIDEIDDILVLPNPFLHQGSTEKSNKMTQLRCKFICCIQDISLLISICDMVIAENDLEEIFDQVNAPESDYTQLLTRTLNIFKNIDENPCNVAFASNEIVLQYNQSKGLCVTQAHLIFCMLATNESAALCDLYRELFTLPYNETLKIRIAENLYAARFPEFQQLLEHYSKEVRSAAFETLQKYNSIKAKQKFTEMINNESQL